MIDKNAIAFKAMSLVTIIFGLVTIKAGGMVLFTEGEAHQAAGDYVPFVLWFNFLAGFAYIVTGILLWQPRAMATWLATIIAVSTLIVFIAFGIHIFLGGAYEMRTVGAMSIRTIFWIGIALISYTINRYHPIGLRKRAGPTS